MREHSFELALVGGLNIGYDYATLVLLLACKGGGDGIWARAVGVGVSAVSTMDLSTHIIAA